MHSHVIRTETKNLAACMDEWVDTGPEMLDGVRDPSRVVGKVDAHYMGGRDWVVTVIHEHVAIPGHDSKTGHVHTSHGTEDPAALDAIGRLDLTIGSMVIGSAPSHVELDALRLERVAGGQGVMVEDADRTWALWTDAQGRPASMWLRREESGAVVAPGIGFDDGGTIFTIDDTSTPFPEDYEVGTGGDEIKPEPGEDYLQWALRERSWFWNECVSARETLRQLGWPDADKSEVPIHQGVTWLAEQGKGEAVVTGAQRSGAEAYYDAVAALHEVTKAPLSTTIGHLIRQGYLRPVHPRGKFFVRWKDGGLTVDGVPVPDMPGQWDVMHYMPAPSATRVDLSAHAKREIVQAVACTLRSLTGLPVDDAVLDD
jgi:hypothetical protein